MEVIPSFNRTELIQSIWNESPLFIDLKKGNSLTDSTEFRKEFSQNLCTFRKTHCFLQPVMIINNQSKRIHARRNFLLTNTFLPMVFLFLPNRFRLLWAIFRLKLDAWMLIAGFMYCFKMKKNLTETKENAMNCSVYCRVQLHPLNGRIYACLSQGLV